MEASFPVLLLIKLPPPLHGASYMNSLVNEILSKHPDIKPKVVNIMSSASSEDIGKTSLAKFFRIFVIYWRVLISMISTRYSLIYLTIAPDGKGFWKDSVILWMLKLSRKPVLVHMHGKGIRQVSQRNLFFAWYYRQVFKGLGVIVLSELLRSDIEHLVPGNRIFVLNNGIPDIEIKQIDRAEMPGPALFLSTMSREKGIFRILDALAWLKNKGLYIRVDCAGPWVSLEEKQAFFNTVSNFELEEFVTYKGVLRGLAKARALDSAYCFLLPTRYPYECFPVAILEALQAGLPVIASDEGAIPDIIQDGRNGFIVNPDNPEALGKAINVLYSDREGYRRMSQEARESYKGRFTIDHFAQGLLRIFYEYLLISKNN